LPDSYEWTKYGFVTPLKNQGSCAAPYAYSAIGAMESHWNILGKGKNFTFS